MRDELIQITEYEMVTSAAEFSDAAAALTARVEADGLDELVRYGFYADEAEGTASAVIVFEDAEAWVHHHQLAPTWPEYEAFRETVTLVRLLFLGDLPQSVADGIEQAGIEARHLGTHRAGFVR